MWFCGSDSQYNRLLYCESVDGKVWSTPILIMDKGVCSYNTSGSCTISVIKESDKLYIKNCIYY